MRVEELESSNHSQMCSLWGGIGEEFFSEKDSQNLQGILRQNLSLVIGECA